MNDSTTYFGDALPLVARLLENMPGVGQFLIVRDLYGRIRLAYDGARQPEHRALAERLRALGAFLPVDGNPLVYREDFFEPDLVFNDPSIRTMQLPGKAQPLRILDRQIVGQEWLDASQPEAKNRLTFYGFKGGVGRTTALAVTAYELARRGLRTLLIDLDLESPGLSSLLLPPDARAEFGLVDWLVEDAVGQSDAVLPQLIAASPIGQATQGTIRIAAAAGFRTGEGSYLSKLARAYVDTNRDGQVETFADRVCRLLNELEAIEQPDVVLIDSRAGLHDLAAISIANLATTAYLFGTSSIQSWQGYRLLFSHWQTYPDTVRTIRDKLVMVHGLFPETNQAENARTFLEESYSLFSETLYDEVEPGNPGTNAFNFDIHDESAPHYPVRVLWNNRLQEFNPLSTANLIDTSLMRATFGAFLARAWSDVGG